mmetsp:Transcript_46/g.95  ORF Transcript_46/g.95 Transcript_46/m.95 type:complete len:202 (-) Transcript_46:753-1358(-)
MPPCLNPTSTFSNLSQVALTTLLSIFSCMISSIFLSLISLLKSVSPKPTSLTLSNSCLALSRAFLPAVSLSSASFFSIASRSRCSWWLLNLLTISLKLLTPVASLISRKALSSLLTTSWVCSNSAFHWRTSFSFSNSVFTNFASSSWFKSPLRLCANSCLDFSVSFLHFSILLALTASFFLLLMILALSFLSIWTAAWLAS